MLETEKWAKYLNESTARGLPKAFDFVKENVKPEEYDKILLNDKTIWTKN